MTLAIFDLDHTLLAGDSDVLWCDFLVRHGLAPADQAERNRALDAGYRSGAVGVAEFCGFYAGLLAGRTPAFWAPWRERFLHEEVLPRIPAGAHTLLQRHRSAGHRLLMSTATHRVITELTAAALDVDVLIATEVELRDGVYTGRLDGPPNMREGKVLRLQAWLAAQGLDPACLATAFFYSDSANDLPLLGAVGFPVAVDPDPRLAAEARARAWPVLALHTP